MANTVLITGASRGIGAATARYFGEQGWQVAVHYHEREDLALELVRELREMGTCAVALGADLACPDQASALPARAEEALATLDALVCGAGIALPQQLVTDTSGDEWRRLMGIDLDGVFYTIRGAVPSFVRRRQGAIVTISSMWGTTGASCEEGSGQGTGALQHSGQLCGPWCYPNGYEPASVPGGYGCSGRSDTSLPDW